MSSSSSSRLVLVLLVLFLADIAAANQSPVPSPTYPPKKQRMKTTPPPAAPPAVDNLAPAPGPSTIYTGIDCTALLFGAADCLSYVVEGSNLTVPDKACCPELDTLVTTNPICLCGLLKKGNALGIAIDMTRALSLPSACKVDTPDPSLCHLVNGSPAGAPGSAPISDGLSPTGAALPPTSVNSDNGAAVGHSTSSLLVALVAVAAFTWNMF